MKHFRRAAALLALCLALLPACVLAAEEAVDSETEEAGITEEKPEPVESGAVEESPEPVEAEAGEESPEPVEAEAGEEKPEAGEAEASGEKPEAEAGTASASEETGRGHTIPGCAVDRTSWTISAAYLEGTTERELRGIIINAMENAGLDVRNVFLGDIEEPYAQDMAGRYWLLDLTELAAVTVNGSARAYAKKLEDGRYELFDALNVPAGGSCYFDGESYRRNLNSEYAVRYKKGDKLTGSVSVTTGFAAVLPGEKLSLSGDSVMRDAAGNPLRVINTEYIAVRAGETLTVTYEDANDDTSDSVTLTVTRGDVKDTYEAAFRNHKAVFSLTGVKETISLEAKAGKRINVTSTVSGSKAFQEFVTVSPSTGLVKQGDTAKIMLSVHGPVKSAREVLIDVKGADLSVDYSLSDYVFARNYANNVLTVRHGTWTGQSLVLRLTAEAGAESVEVTVTEGETIDCSVFSFFTAQRASAGGCEIGLTLENDAGENQNAVAVVAAYDASDRMTAVRVADAGALEAEGTEELKLLFDGDIEADHWKVFVYDPATGQPLARAAVGQTG